MKKTVLITGADRGLGSAMTERWAQAGWTVYAGQYMPEWPEISALQERFPGQIISLALDVSSDESVAEAAEKFASMETALDLIINCAGIICRQHDTIIDAKPDIDAIIATMQVNTFGPMRVTHAFLPFLLQGNEKILLNISSEAGSISANWRDGDFGYCMSKAALNMQSAILQHHLKRKGVRVFAVHPGWLKSWMSGERNENAEIEPKDSADGIFKLLEQHPEIGGHMYFDFTGKEWQW